jgi:hypothetical protein
MATLLFELDHLFASLVPELVAISFPSEVEFVQEFLPLLSHCVIVMIGPLPANPLPWRLVMLASLGDHHATAIVLFKLDQLFTLNVPLLIKFRHGSKREETMIHN